MTIDGLTQLTLFFFFLFHIVPSIYLYSFLSYISIHSCCVFLSFLCFKAVLVLYFKYFIGWDNDFSTTIYHTFVALCYLTPILGAIIADSWLGKFK